MRDPPGAAALRGADLDGERRPDLSQEALDCRSLAGRHLPIVIGERVHGGPYDLILAGIVCEHVSVLPYFSVAACPRIESRHLVSRSCRRRDVVFRLATTATSAGTPSRLPTA